LPLGMASRDNRLPPSNMKKQIVRRSELIVRPAELLHKMKAKRQPRRVANPARDLLEALMAESAPSIVPKGFYTVRQLSEATGIPRQTVAKRLDAMGAECKLFKVSVGHLVRPTPHYRLI
jgi:hypothetical protein